MGYASVNRCTSFSAEEESISSLVWIQFQRTLEGTPQLKRILPFISRVFKAGYSLSEQNACVLNEAIEQCLAFPEFSINEEIVRDAIIFLGSMPKLCSQTDCLASNIAKFISKAADSLQLDVVCLIKDLINLRQIFESYIVFLFDDCHSSRDFRQLMKMVSKCTQYFVQEVDNIAEIHQICRRLFHCSNNISGFRSDFWIPGIVTMVCTTYKRIDSEVRTLVESLIQETITSLNAHKMFKIELRPVLTFLLILSLRFDMWDYFSPDTKANLVNYLKTMAESDYKENYLEQLFFASCIRIILTMIEEQSVEADRAIIRDLQAVLRLFKVAPEESIMEVLKMTREFFETQGSMMGFNLSLKWRKILRLIKMKVRQQDVSRYFYSFSKFDFDSPFWK